MKSLLVEGWRGINHSYSLVNENQLLCMARYPIALFHRDSLNHGWNRKSNASGLPLESEKILSRIPTPPSDLVLDATYRISHPYNYEPAQKGALFVFGTSELQHIKGHVADDNFDVGLANHSMHIITPSRWSAIGFFKAGFDESRVHVVPHGVNLDIFKPQSDEARKLARQKLGLAPGEFVIMSVGAMTWNKGVDVLVLAFARLRQKYKHAVLMLKDQKGLYDLTAAEVVRKAAIEHPDLVTAEVLGAIMMSSENYNLRSLAAMYSAADCYVSSYRAEGFSLPPLEAAACGVPIVVTKGGATDIYADPSFVLQIEGKISEAEQGHYIEPDVESLVEQLTLLIEGRTPQLDSQKAIKYIQQNFSWQSVTRQLMAEMKLI